MIRTPLDSSQTADVLNLPSGDVSAIFMFLSVTVFAERDTSLIFCTISFVFLSLTKTYSEFFYILSCC